MPPPSDFDSAPTQKAEFSDPPCPDKEAFAPPGGYVAATGIIVLAVLIATQLLFDPWAAEAMRRNEQQARIVFGDELNAGIELGRVVRHRGLEEVHLRFFNRTGKTFESRINIRCVALSRVANILGSGIGRLRLSQLGPFQPGASLKLVVSIEDLSKRSHSVSCSVAHAA